MSDFFDALASIPILVVAGTILAGLLIGCLIFLAFESIEPLEDEEPYTAERATREHLDRIRRDRIRQAHQDLRGHR